MKRRQKREASLKCVRKKRREREGGREGGRGHPQHQNVIYI